MLLSLRAQEVLAIFELLQASFCEFVSSFLLCKRHNTCQLLIEDVEDPLDVLVSKIFESVQTDLVFAMVNVPDLKLPMLAELLQPIGSNPVAEVAEHGALVGQDGVAMHQQVEAGHRARLFTMGDQWNIELLGMPLQGLADDVGLDQRPTRRAVDTDEDGSRVVLAQFLQGSVDFFGLLRRGLWDWNIHDLVRLVLAEELLDCSHLLIIIYIKM